MIPLWTSDEIIYLTPRGGIFIYPGPNIRSLKNYS